jgi:outer membrane biosynthesis protein TonB
MEISKSMLEQQMEFAKGVKDLLEQLPSSDTTNKYKEQCEDTIAMCRLAMSATPGMKKGIQPDPVPAPIEITKNDDEQPEPVQNVSEPVHEQPEPEPKKKRSHHRRDKKVEEPAPEADDDMDDLF